MVLLELVGAVLPPGVLNVVNGYGREAGQPLAESKRIAKIAFTGSTAVGRTVAAAAAANLISARPLLRIPRRASNLPGGEVAKCGAARRRKSPSTSA